MTTTTMEKQDTKQEDAPTPTPTPETTKKPVADSSSTAPRDNKGRGSIRGRTERPRRARARTPRPRGEFEQVTIDARRVARVMAGGRRFSFSLVVAIGDKKGRVGVGIGKGVDTALAIDKAVRDAKKHLFTVPRTSSGSILYSVKTKYVSSIVEIIPSPGRGLVAGSAMRVVLDLAGVTDVVTKIHSRSKNKLTIARATVKALKELSTR